MTAKRLLTVSILVAGLSLRVLAAVHEGGYRVVLSEGADAAEVFRGCACAVEEQGGALVVRASRATALRLASDPRVATVEELAPIPPRMESANAAPVRTEAVASWSSGSYSYDGAGNVTQIGTDLYTYDGAGRLKTARTSGVTEEYTYDRYGNLIRTVGTMPSASQYTYEAAAGADNRLTSAQYDAAGRMTVATGLTVAYDELDMPTEITTGGLRRVHLYTAGDERIATITFTALNNGLTGTDWTLRDVSGKVLRRLHQNPYGAWSWEQDYIYRDSTLLASEVAGEHRTLHYFPDHLGTPRIITNHTGAQVGLHKYYPYGREQTSATQNAERVKFTGHERDTATLDYMHARYYGLEWGRFLSVDPTWASADLGKPQSWNRYAYVMNNPINMTDPDGRCPTCVDPSDHGNIIRLRVNVWYDRDSVDRELVRGGTVRGRTERSISEARAIFATAGIRLDFVRQDVDTTQDLKIITGSGATQLQEFAKTTPGLDIFVTQDQGVTGRTVGVGGPTLIGNRVGDGTVTDELAHALGNTRSLLPFANVWTDLYTDFNESAAAKGKPMNEMYTIMLRGGAREQCSADAGACQ